MELPPSLEVPSMPSVERRRQPPFRAMFGSASSIGGKPKSSSNDPVEPARTSRAIARSASARIHRAKDPESPVRTGALGDHEHAPRPGRLHRAEAQLALERCDAVRGARSGGQKSRSLERCDQEPGLFVDREAVVTDDRVPL